MSALRINNNILLKDEVKYLQRKYRNEDELEEIFEEHYKDIFGRNVLLIPKKKIETESGLGTIPDGFIIDIDNKEWFIIEVELSVHEVYEHVLSQISKFNMKILKTSKLTDLKDFVYNEVKTSPRKKLIFEERNISEIYRFIVEILNKRPLVIIIIDEFVKELEDVLENLPLQMKAIELKTYIRNGKVKEDHIHNYQPYAKAVIESETKQLKEMVISGGKKGIKIRGQFFPCRYAREILIKTANWLIEQRAIKDEDLPIESSKVRYLINKKPIHQRGNRFADEKKLTNGSYIEVNRPKNGCIRWAKKLLDKFGYSKSDLEIINF